MKKKAIDIATIIGVVLSFGLVFFGIIVVVDNDTKAITGINMDALINFYDLPSVLIVIGGTIGVLLMMFPITQFTKIIKHASILYMPKVYDPAKYITELTEIAQKARVSGLLSLEEDVAQMDDMFMKNSVQMIVDSVDPEAVKAQMEEWMGHIEGRHEQECSFYDKGAAIAPGFGMIGTLIGLVNLMKNLSDINSVGPSMAVALITTFYGSVLSNVVFMPIGNKLRVRHEEEFLCLLIISEGVQAIQAGENPKFIETKLLNMLPEYKQKELIKKGKIQSNSGAAE